jgi:hypothetical protein
VEENTDEEEKEGDEKEEKEVEDCSWSRIIDFFYQTQMRIFYFHMMFGTFSMPFSGNLFFKPINPAWKFGIGSKVSSPCWSWNNATWGDQSLMLFIRFGVNGDVTFELRRWKYVWKCSYQCVIFNNILILPQGRLKSSSQIPGRSRSGCINEIPTTYITVSPANGKCIYSPTPYRTVRRL